MAVISSLYNYNLFAHTFTVVVSCSHFVDLLFFLYLSSVHLMFTLYSFLARPSVFFPSVID